MTKLSKFINFNIALGVVLLLSGCVTSVSRVGTDTNLDISGGWNDVDSRLISDALAEDMFKHSWYERYARSISGRMPTIIVGVIRNNSNEHINTETFTKDIERAAINSGQINVVAASNQQQQIRDERLAQSQFASVASRKQLKQELGADLIILGSINAIDDVEGKRSVRYYQVDIEAVDIETNRKLWIGQKEIKKFVQKPRIRL